MHTLSFKKISMIALTLTLFFSSSVLIAQSNSANQGGSQSGLLLNGGTGGQSSGLTVTGGTGGQNSGLTVTGGTGGSQSNLGKPKLSLPGIVMWFVGLLNYVVVLILTASLVVFLYGVFKLSFVDGTNPESMAKSRKFMLWGIVSLFVMVSVWGLVNILKTSIFGGGSLILPQLK